MQRRRPDTLPANFPESGSLRAGVSPDGKHFHLNPSSETQQYAHGAPPSVCEDQAGLQGCADEALTMWRSMDSAPINGTPFVALERWKEGSKARARVYKYTGHPNYWHCQREGVCIRPSYQDQYVWAPLPSDNSSSPLPHVNWRCDECGCRSLARCDERKASGEFAPGPDGRCEECKKVHKNAYANPSPETHVKGKGLQIADAIEACDWSGCSIGNKEILKAAVRQLRALATEGKP